MGNKKIQAGMLDRCPETNSILIDLDLIVTLPKHDDGFRPVSKIFDNYEDNPTYRKYFYIVEDNMNINDSINYLLDCFKYKIDDDFDIITMQFKEEGQEIIYAEKLHEKARLNK